jgi:hypothetical protein
MLLLTIINTCFPAVKDIKCFEKKTLLKIQNFYAMCVLTHIMYSLFHFYQSRNYETIISSVRYLSCYVAFDLLLCEKIMYFHHSLCIVMGYIFFKNPRITYLAQDFIVSVITTEVSTFFLTVRAIVEEYKHYNQYIMITYNVNNVVFSGTFMYTRIYIFVKALRMDEYKMILSSLTFVESISVQFCLISLLLLNMYWGFLIMKISLQLFKKPSLERG